jgi:hypothetical protein
MARNIEIKARIESVEAMRSKTAALADHGPIEVLHDDAFTDSNRNSLSYTTHKMVCIAGIAGY